MVALTLALRRGPQGFILRDWSVSCGCSGPGLGSLASEVFTLRFGVYVMAALAMALGRGPRRLLLWVWVCELWLLWPWPRITGLEEFVVGL